MPGNRLAAMLAGGALCGCVTARPGDSAPGGGSSLVCTGTMNPQIRDVIDVSWAIEPGAISYVDFGVDSVDEHRTPDTAASAVALSLIGLPPDTDVQWRGVSVRDGQNATCTGTTRTGSLPADLPAMTADVDALSGGLPDDAAPYVIGAFFTAGGGELQLAAYDRSGAVVWYYEGTPGTSSLDVHYARDADGLLFNEFHGMMGGADGHIRRITMGGTEVAAWEAPNAHHTFTELPDGTLTYQKLDIRAYEDPATGQTGDWVGDALVEIPVSGEATTVYSVWDTLTPTWNDHMNGFSIYNGLDWTHGNLVRYDEDEDRYLLSLAHAADVLDIDRATATATAIWGPDGTLASPPFDYQHDPGWLDATHLLMFMSESGGSGAIEYELRDGALTEVWRHGFEHASLALGQAERLENGDTFINYGAAGRMEEVAPDGTVLWTLTATPSGGPAAVLGQFTVVRDLYTGAR